MQCNYIDIKYVYQVLTQVQFMDIYIHVFCVVIRKYNSFNNIVNSYVTDRRGPILSTHVTLVHNIYVNDQSGQCLQLRVGSTKRQKELYIYYITYLKVLLTPWNLTLIVILFKPEGAKGCNAILPFLFVFIFLLYSFSM